MPDVSLSLTVGSAGDRSLSALEKENLVLKQRIELMEKELIGIYGLSANVRRSSSTLHALSSVSIKPINEEALITYVSFIFVWVWK